MTTHTIPAQHLTTLYDRIDRLNKTAGKLGLPEITVTETAREIKPQMKGEVETGIFTEWVTLEVNGTSPIIAGWSFIAQIAHGEPGNIVRNLSDQPLPEVYRTAPANCDHCRTNRARNETYILQNAEGEYKQVGSSCLKDFTGHADPHAIASWLEGLHALDRDLIDSDGDDDFISGSGSHLVYSGYFLSNVAAIIRTDGWLSKSKVREIGAGVSTCDKACDNMLNKRFAPSKWIELIESDYTLAKAAIEWGRTQDGQSEYEWNLKIVSGPEYCEPRNLGILASLIPAYRKAQCQTETGDKTASQFIGTVGDKIKIEVTITRVNEIEGAYGLTSVVSMKAGDNVLTWFASGAVELEPGKQYTIKGTVKKQEPYNGINTTYLTRCKVQ